MTFKHADSTELGLQQSLHQTQGDLVVHAGVEFEDGIQVERRIDESKDATSIWLVGSPHRGNVLPRHR